MNTSWQTGSSLLLAATILAYGYFLPTIVAFLRGHPRFYSILVLNVFVAPVQIAILHFIFPASLKATSATLLVIVSFVEVFGAGWAFALLWSLMPIPAPSPTLIEARNTKAFDLFAAVPLILWFSNVVLVQFRPVLAQDAGAIAAQTAGLYIYVQFFSLSAAALLNLLMVYLLVVRDRPVLRSTGVIPRLCGVLGTFLAVGILRLPVAPLSLPMQITAALLVGVGSIGSILALARLGKAFSILPEARKLVTSGPYAYARHPLYAMEMVAIAGTAVQFAQPWATMLALGVGALEVTRSIFEERVLEDAYPVYGDYRRKTKRFIPGII